MKIRRTDLGRIFKKKIGIFPIPVEIFGDVYCRDRKGKGLTALVPFGHHFIKSFVYKVHLRLEMFVCHRCQRTCATLFGFLLKLFVLYIFKKMSLISCRDLIFEICWNCPVYRDVGKGALSPSCGYIEVIDEASDRFFYLPKGEIVSKDIGCQIGIETAKCLCSSPLALKYPQKVRHLPKRLSEVFWRFALHPPPHTVEPLIQKYPQTPSGTVTAETIKIMDVVISVSVCISLLFGVYLIKPVVRDHLSCGVVDQSGIGVACVGVGLDPPVTPADVLLNRLRGVDIGRIFSDKTLSLHLMGMAIEHKRAHHSEVTLFIECILYHILHLLHRDRASAFKLFEHISKDATIINDIFTCKCLFDGIFDLVGKKLFVRPVSLQNRLNHTTTP